MSLFSLLFTDEVTSISSSNKDGYGTITYSALYTKVPCKFFRKNTLIYNGQFIDDGTVATITLPPEYTKVAPGHMLVYNNESYKISSVSELKGVLGNSQGIQLRLKSYGG